MSEPSTTPAPRRRQAARPHCAICGEPTREPIAYGMVRPSLANRLTAEHPHLSANDVICRRHLTEHRTRYVEQLLERERGEISDLERQVVESLAREETVARNVEETWEDRRTVGERVADIVAEFGGSWRFIISFGVVLVLWMAFNVWAAAREVFDPYPFILLNLILSCLAAVQAPVILMSQNRQTQKDRLHAQLDYEVNLKAEMEILALHEKLDLLREKAWSDLVALQERQLGLLSRIEREIAERHGAGA